VLLPLWVMRLSCPVPRSVLVWQHDREDRLALVPRLHTALRRTSRGRALVVIVADGDGEARLRPAAAAANRTGQQPDDSPRPPASAWQATRYFPKDSSSDRGLVIADISLGPPSVSSSSLSPALVGGCLNRILGRACTGGRASFRLGRRRESCRAAHGSLGRNRALPEPRSPGTRNEMQTSADRAESCARPPIRHHAGQFGEQFP